MEDLAEEAGVSKGTLYLYFESKDSIVKAIMESLIVRELDNARALLKEGGTSSEKLLDLSRLMHKDLRRIEPIVGLYFEFLALTIRSKSGKEMVQGSF